MFHPENSSLHLISQFLPVSGWLLCWAIVPTSYRVVGWHDPEPVSPGFELIDWHIHTPHLRLSSLNVPRRRMEWSLWKIHIQLLQKRQDPLKVIKDLISGLITKLQKQERRHFVRCKALLQGLASFRNTFALPRCYCFFWLQAASSQTKKAPTQEKAAALPICSQQTQQHAATARPSFVTGLLWQGDWWGELGLVCYGLLVFSEVSISPMFTSHRPSCSGTRLQRRRAQ